MGNSQVMKEKVWTKDRKQVLQDVYPQLGAAGCFEALGGKIPKNSIRRQASRMGLTSPFLSPKQARGNLIKEVAKTSGKDIPLDATALVLKYFPTSSAEKIAEKVGIDVQQLDEIQARFTLQKVPHQARMMDCWPDKRSLIDPILKLRAEGKPFSSIDKALKIHPPVSTRLYQILGLMKLEPPHAPRTAAARHMARKAVHEFGESGALLKYNWILDPPEKRSAVRKFAA